MRPSRGKLRSVAAASGLAIGLVLAASMLRTTDWRDPPRFDGAGYAILARALATGQGYREIDRPDAPRHAHFPPGYPLTLALIWRVTGSVGSVRLAHGLSFVCTLGAALAAWRWFRVMHGVRVAALLGLALAVNWTWTRTGGSIQSEPLFLLLGQVTILAALGVGRRDSLIRSLGLGLLLGACVLTRHVGVALVAAVLLELALRGRSRAALTAGATCLAAVIPWFAWTATVSRNTQAGLLIQDHGWSRFAGQVVFYAERIPDALSGPFVEIATVFRGDGAIRLAAELAAVVATGIVVAGWFGGAWVPRRRLASLVGGVSLALLLVWPFTEAGRFLIPLIPCLLVGAVDGLSRIGRRVGLKPSRARSWAAALLLVGALPYSIYALASDRAGAQRRTHASFDDACRWIATEARKPGPILTRHPGEVYWQTGRQALTPDSTDPAAVSAAIARFGVAYLLVDDERYVNAPPSPLARYVEAVPESVRAVWRRDAGRSSIVVYAVVEAGDGSQGFGGDAKRSRP